MKLKWNTVATFVIHLQVNNHIEATKASLLPENDHKTAIVKTYLEAIIMYVLKVHKIMDRSELGWAVVAVYIDM